MFTRTFPVPATSDCLVPSGDTSWTGPRFATVAALVLAMATMSAFGNRDTQLDKTALQNSQVETNSKTLPDANYERTPAEPVGSGRNNSELQAEDDSGLKVMWTKPLGAPSFGGAAVADVDGDGRLEIAFGTYFGDDSVRVLNGEDGSQLWQYDAGSACLDASMRFFDLDADGDLELLVPISNKGQMIAFEPDTGKQIWSYQPTPTECTDSPSTILDLDGDGKVEFVYGTFHGKLHVVDAETGKAKRIYKVCDKKAIQTAPTVLDLNGDGTLDFVCGTMRQGKNHVYAIDGKSGEHLWEFQISGNNQGMYHGCSVGDLEGDGTMELVFSAFDAKVYCLNAMDGSKKWELRPGDAYFMSPTALADLDKDGILEVISASQRVSVINHRGEVLWSKPCSSRGEGVTRGPSLADLNGDGQLDIVTLSGNGEFQVLSGHDGNQLYEFRAAEHTEFTPMMSSHGVTIADFNGDRKLDVFFVVGTPQKDSKAGLAICLTGFEGSGSGWYMLRHDPRSTGNVQTKIETTLLQHIENLTENDR